jgi:predicted Zn-ribbon and HTH transcriptional regulator
VVWLIVIIYAMLGVTALLRQSMRRDTVLTNQMTHLRCPECGHISLKKDDVSFFCQNPKCKVNRIIGDNLVVIKQ